MSSNRKLNVYRIVTILTGTNTRAANRNPQVEAIVAAPSLTAAADAMGISPYQLRTHGGVTKNEQSTAAALSKPGTVFYRGATDFTGAWQEWSTEAQTIAQARRQNDIDADRKAKARVDTYRQEQEARQQRRVEATRRATEIREKILPVLIELGVHPDTVKVDGGNLSLPAEAMLTVADTLAEIIEAGLS